MKPTRTLLALLFVALAAANLLAQPALVPDPKFQVKLSSAAESSSWNWLVQPDGKIVLAGRFESIRGQAVPDIIRLLPDGTIDQTFKSERGAIPHPSLVGLQSGNRVLIREADPNFPYDLQLPKTSSVHRLDAEGRLDPSFRWPSGDLRVLAILPDDRIIAYRRTIDSGRNRDDLFRLTPEGAVDSGFSGQVLNGEVLAIASHTDGKLVIGGSFNDVSGRPWPHLARLNADGSLDQSFVLTTNVAGSGAIWRVAVQNDGKVLAEGYALRRPLAFGVIRLNSDGTRDSTLDAILQPDANRPTSEALFAVQSGGDILISVYDEASSAERMLRLRADGTLLDTIELDPNLLPGIDGSPRGIAGLGRLADVLPDGKVIVRYVSAGGHYLPRLVRLNMDFSVDHSFPPAIPEVSGGEVRILARSGDKLILSGSFVSVNGHISPRLARLNADGSVDTNFVADPAMPSLVGLDRAERTLLGAIAAPPDGKLLLHGPLGSLVRLNTDGGLDDSFRPTISIGAPVGFWQSWSAGMQRPILGIQSDGRVVVQKADEGRLARLGIDGSMDPAFAPVFTGGEADDGDTYSPFTALAVQNDDRIVIAGSFTNVNGVARHGLALLNSDGTLDTTFDAGVPFEAPNQPDQPGDFISDLAVDAEGRVLVGGNFFKWHDQRLDLGLVRLHPDGRLNESFRADPAGLFPGFEDNRRAVKRIQVLSADSLLIESWIEMGALLRSTGQTIASFGDSDGSFVETAVEDARMGLVFTGWRTDSFTGDRVIGVWRFLFVPVFRQPRWMPGLPFTATLGVLPGVPHRIETSSDLVNWQTVTTVTSPTENLPFTAPEAANAPRRFYRVVAVVP